MHVKQLFEWRKKKYIFGIWPQKSSNVKLEKHWLYRIEYLTINATPMQKVVSCFMPLSKQFSFCLIWHALKNTSLLYFTQIISDPLCFILATRNLRGSDLLHLKQIWYAWNYSYSMLMVLLKSPIHVFRNKIFSK